MDETSTIMAESLVGDLLIVRLDDLSATIRLGVSDSERAAPQDVLVSIALTLARVPLARDDLAHTIDYDHIIGFVQEALPAMPPVKLLETTAERIASFCLSLSADALEVEVIVKKPSVLKGNGLVSILLRRSK